MVIYKALASFFGIGYVKGSGTIASVLCCLLIYCLNENIALSITTRILILIIVTAIGIVCAYKVESSWGKDSSRVVIDEVSGIFLSLLLVPINPLNLLVALIVFRYFDICKPLGIRKLDRIDQAWAVMADDLLAGAYTLICLQVFQCFI